MNLLFDALPRPLVEGLGWTLLHFVWQGAAVAIIAAIVLACLRRRSANARYVVACLALLMMAVLPVATFWAICPQPTARVAVVEAPPPEPPAITPPAAPAHELEPVQATPGTETVSPAPAPVHVAHAPVIPIREPWYHTWTARAEAWMPWIVLAWLAGVIALATRLLAGWIQVQRLRRQSLVRSRRAGILACTPRGNPFPRPRRMGIRRILVSRWVPARRDRHSLRQQVEPISTVWQAVLEELANRLRVSRPVLLLESAWAQVPMAIGWLRPVILLPACALTGLTPEQLRAMIAHELAHIRRYDYLVNLIQTAVETLLFYHPAVWWVSRCIRAEREHCCDDVVVTVCGGPMPYARALAQMAELSLAGLQMAPAATGGSTSERIRRLLGVSAPRSRQISGWLPAALALMVAIGVVMSACRSTEPTRGTDQAATQPADATAHAATQPTTDQADITGVVRSPDGTPASGATVALATFSHGVVIVNGRMDTMRDTIRTETSDDGEFSLPEPQEEYTLVAYHGRGYAEAKKDKLTRPVEITLQPWGRIEGTLTIGAKPGGNQAIWAEFPWDFPKGPHPPKVFWSNSTYTDAAGRFSFERLLPGRGQVSHTTSALGGTPAREYITVWDHSDSYQAQLMLSRRFRLQSLPIEVKAGETCRVTMDGTGRPIIGRAKLPEGVDQKVDWTWASWHLSPGDHPTESASMDYSSPTGPLKADGSFRIDDVPAGTYELRIRLDEPHPTGVSRMTRELGTIRRQVVVPHVPGGRSDDPLDLGTLVLDVPDKPITTRPGATQPSGERAVLVDVVQLKNIKATEAEAMLKDLLKRLQQKRGTDKELAIIKAEPRLNILVISVPEPDADADLRQIKQWIGVIDVPPAAIRPVATQPTASQPAITGEVRSLNTILNAHESAMAGLRSGQGRCVVELHETNSVASRRLSPETLAELTRNGVDPRDGWVRKDVHWWFSGEEYRSDMTSLPLEKGEASLMIPLSVRNVRSFYDGQADIEAYSRVTGSQEGRWTVDIRKPAGPSQKMLDDRLNGRDPVDVRDLQLPDGFSLKSRIDRIRSQGYAITIESKDNLIIIRAEKPEEGRREEIQVDTAQGFNVVRDVGYYRDGKQKWIDFTAQYQQVDGSWLLKELSYHRVIGHGGVDRVVDLKVTMAEAKLGQCIEDKVFSIAGLDLPAGTRVHDERFGDSRPAETTRPTENPAANNAATQPTTRTDAGHSTGVRPWGEPVNGRPAPRTDATDVQDTTPKIAVETRFITIPAKEEKRLLSGAGPGGADGADAWTSITGSHPPEPHSEEFEGALFIDDFIDPAAAIKEQRAMFLDDKQVDSLLRSPLAIMTSSVNSSIVDAPRLIAFDNREASVSVATYPHLTLPVLQTGLFAPQKRVVPLYLGRELHVTPTLSADGLRVTLALDAFVSSTEVAVGVPAFFKWPTSKKAVTNPKDQECARAILKTDVPLGYTLLVRTPIVHTRIKGIRRAPDVQGQTAYTIVRETAKSPSDTATFLYLLVKPTLDKTAREGTLLQPPTQPG